MPANSSERRSNNGLLFAYALRESGDWAAFDLEDFEQVDQDAKLIWLGFDYSKRASRDWLKAQLNLGEVVSKALFAPETRPRTTLIGNNALVNLRGMNFSSQTEPQDMISIRTWITEKIIITTQRRRILSMLDLQQAINEGRGPSSAGDFIVMLCDYLTARSAGVLDDLDEKLDQMEEAVLVAQSRTLRVQLAELRRQIVTLRRYLAPQREAMYRLQAETLPWLSTNNKLNLRESVDRVTRHVEDLDSARDRASVTQEELMGRLSEQIEQRTYILTIVAAIFLPLSFLTGLLGINVGGIPATQSSWGFTVVAGICLLIIIIELIICKRKKWL